MRDLSTILYNLRCFLGVVIQLLCYGVRFCWALLLPKLVLAARLTASESQLGELVERVRRDRVQEIDNQAPSDSANVTLLVTILSSRRAVLGVQSKGWERGPGK
ncbi:MAG: hypothetical protein JSV79_06415 [Armatimonadota bacterium]|nr:MAG: hypothetical protein JSV79_06415 [Armatimonadota bacterium]